ncbi:hypothetical protein ACTG9Q_32035 [Actinokineospora sp. 24-640]
MTDESFSWGREHRIATDYAARRLGHRPEPVAPGDFGVVWANMSRGLHLGELRELPALDNAFDDWLREHTAAPSRPCRVRPAWQGPRRHVSAHVNGHRPYLACGPRNEAREAT